MKNKMNNVTHIEGWVYQHKLESKITGENSKNPGTSYITGSIEIATDNSITNIVPVYFTYVTATTSKGKPNTTYSTLMNIINGTHETVMSGGVDKALKVRIDSAIGLNEFYIEKNGQEELVSAKRNSGGFIHVTNELVENESLRNTFDLDMIITNVVFKEGNPEFQTEDKVVLKGVTFDFKKSLLPIEVSATDPRAMAYFEGLEASPNNPVFTRVKGNQVSKTIVKQTKEESAFGAPSIKEVKSTQKDFVVNWAQQEPYTWDSEESILASELRDLMAEREVYLATLKKAYTDRKASKGSAFTVPASVASGGFNF